MSNWKEKYRQTFSYSIWFGVALIFLVLIGATTKKHKSDPCKNVQINIQNLDNTTFVDDVDIKAMIRNVITGDAETLPLYSIDIQSIESDLKKFHQIRDAQVWFDNRSTLHVYVDQKKPIARVVNSSNVSYYIDNTGQKFPLSNKFTARVPVVTGEIVDNGLTYGSDSTTLFKNIYELVSYIETDTLWSAMIEQIVVDRHQEFTLIPKWGDQKIKIGDARHLGVKFNRLKLFYEKAIHELGWNTYSEINVRYKGQVVCTRKHTQDG